MTKTIKKILVLTLLATTLTACGSGQTAETRMIKQVTDGVEAQSAEIRLRNVKIVKNELSQVLIASKFPSLAATDVVIRSSDSFNPDFKSASLLLAT